MNEEIEELDNDLKVFEIVISFEETNFQIIKVNAPNQELAVEKIKHDFHMNAPKHQYHDLKFRSVQEVQPNQLPI